MDSERIDKSTVITFEEDVLAEVKYYGEYRSRGFFNRSRSPLDEEASSSPDEVPTAVPGNPEYLVTEAETANSYFSATLSTIQPLGNNKSLLTMVIACHPAPGRRFINATITWNISAPSSSSNEKKTPGPKIITLAPQKSSGGWTEEQSSLRWSVSVPVNGTLGPASMGVEPSVEKETRKVIAHAMSITGTVRGIGGIPHAIWTVEENKSSGSGIPSHFQLAIVVDHVGPFVSDLDVNAQLGGGLVTSSLRTKKDKRGNIAKRVIDVEVWKRGNILWDMEAGESGWKKYVAGITGEVDGLVHNFTQAIVRP